MPVSKAVGEFVAQDREVPAVAATDTVAAAVAKMKATSTEGVVVLNGESLIGVFTERDFLDRVAGAGLNPAETPVEDVMTRDPEYLSVLDDIAYAINKMAVGGFRNVPLVDDGKVAAVLNVHDVIGHLFDLFVEASDRESSELNPWTDVGGG